MCLILDCYLRHVHKQEEIDKQTPVTIRNSGQASHYIEKSS